MTDNASGAAPRVTAPEGDSRQPERFNIFRFTRVPIAGVLMGTANLIPGVSGGTMVLAMGLYQEFIDSVADITALRFSGRRIAFLGVLGVFLLIAVKVLVGAILYMLFHYPVAMYAAFIGLTLGGAPLLVRLLRPLRADVVVATLVGLGLMVGVLFLRQGGVFPHNLPMDFIAGVVGATTMVLPGVSGSYILLVMGQYERIMGAIKDLNLAILAPFGIGVVLGIVGLSHLLKLLLHRYERLTVGVLLGILLGSVIGLWPFGKGPSEKALQRRDVAELRSFAHAWQVPIDPDIHEHDELVAALHGGWAERGRPTYAAGDVALAITLIGGGFAVTWSLGRIQRKTPEPANEVDDVRDGTAGSRERG